MKTSSFLVVLLLLVTPFIWASPSTVDDLIISEYGEGSSSNKYIEIYNGTDQLVDLAILSNLENY